MDGKSCLNAAFLEDKLHETEANSEKITAAVAQLGGLQNGWLDY